MNDMKRRNYSWVLAGLMLLSPVAVAQSPFPFVPGEFQVPRTLQGERFRLRMLTIHDVVKDYDAVMSSREHLKGAFGPKNGWPFAGMTLEQNLVDLGWHQGEFIRRRSFAYTVVDLAESRVLGCVYVNPTRKQGYDAAVFLWVRTSEVDKGLDAVLYDTVKRWMTNDWPFKRVAYPGRDIGWDVWEATPEP